MLARTITSSGSGGCSQASATVAREAYGVDGTGVGIAVIDSGVTAWHDDLSLTSRVIAFGRGR